jgi:hypothetical protein
VKPAAVAAVLEKLEIDRPSNDLPGLRHVYAAWCARVPFDNVLKMIHTAERRRGPLPGSTPSGFFEDWLECGAGGTCWAGNGALHGLLDALGFDVELAIATMMPSGTTRGPNHGSVVAAVEGRRWITDASILSGEPIRLLEAGEAAEPGPLPRLEWLDGRPAVIWRMLRAPDGFPCRIERVGADAAEWNEFHRRSGVWSPFNYELSTRIVRESLTVGISSGQRFAIERGGSVSAVPADRVERTRFLVEELGISEAVAVRVPDDRPPPPRPEHL